MEVRLFIVIILYVILLFVPDTAYSCYVLNKERARVGVDDGFRGECSNNGYEITCVLKEGSWVECSGPEGSATGTNLNSLIYSICGCSAQDERERSLQEQMRNY
jgi:hypothetical protein